MRNPKRFSPIAELTLTAAAIICCVSSAQAKSALSAGGADSEWQRLESGGKQSVRAIPAEPTLTASQQAPVEPVSSAKSAAPMPTALPAQTPAPSPTPAVVSEVFRLHAGESLQTQLEAWAARAGWKISWNSPDSWVVPNEKAYSTDFVESARAVIEDIARNGADLVYDAWTENRVVVIQQGGQ